MRQTLTVKSVVSHLLQDVCVGGNDIGKPLKTDKYKDAYCSIRFSMPVSRFYIKKKKKITLPSVLYLSEFSHFRLSITAITVVRIIHIANIARDDDDDFIFPNTLLLASIVLKRINRSVL